MTAAMQIKSDQVSYRKKVGRIGNSPVMEIGLIGGLNLIVSTENGKTSILGTGPHRAVSRHIAKRRAPDIEWTEIQKSDHVEPEFFEALLPRYEALTDELRKE